jgi:putative flavoprotein involved in K+ transport
LKRIEIAVIGAGQAGLAMSHELTLAGIDHVVLERRRLGDTWRRRWDSFCLVTPNWTVRLPGFPYAGDDPDGYMKRDEIVVYLELYARSFGCPVMEGVAVESVRQKAAGGFVLNTSSGALWADVLVLTTGAYQRPHRIPQAQALPPRLLQLDVDGYRNPGALPAGGVLVIGSGQSGAQIAEELRLAGREVYLSCGRAPWAHRRLSGRDILWWLLESRFMDQTVDALPSPSARLLANPMASGHDGGHDLHLRTLQAMGVTLTGRFIGANDREAWFAPDLPQSAAWGDARYAELMSLFRKLAADRGVDPPQAPDLEPLDTRAPERLDLADIDTVVFAGGFRPDYHSWLPWPDAFDALGFPLQRDGASTVVPGLFFLGVHFLRTRKSSLLVGVGEDATVIAGQMAQRSARRRAGTG